MAAGDDPMERAAREAKRISFRWSDIPLPEQIERRARALAGDLHRAGVIPHRFWKEAIREHLAETAPRSEGERVNRAMRGVLLDHLRRLEEEAKKEGWA